MTHGRKPTVPGGFSKVLYVRVSRELHELLFEALAEEQEKPRDGIQLSLADLVRGILWKDIRARREKRVARASEDELKAEWKKRQSAGKRK